MEERTRLPKGASPRESQNGFASVHNPENCVSKATKIMDSTLPQKTQNGGGTFVSEIGLYQIFVNFMLPVAIDLPFRL
jgi:hypothetical protein